jgi:ankyrin repeat protein
MILRIMQVKAALMRGVDVDLTNTAGWTALHAAAAGGHTKILDVLLRADADINIRDRGGNLPVRGGRHWCRNGGSTREPGGTDYISAVLIAC